jgi:hypothetical protein
MHMFRLFWGKNATVEPKVKISMYELNDEKTFDANQFPNNVKLLQEAACTRQDIVDYCALKTTRAFFKPYIVSVL